MRRLRWKIYLTIIATLAMVVLVAGLLWRFGPAQGPMGQGAELAAEVGALSADHLEHVSPRGISALRDAGVVAVSLPLATLYLGQRPMPARAKPMASACTARAPTCMCSA